jgi:hypothetical protein
MRFGQQGWRVALHILMGMSVSLGSVNVSAIEPTPCDPNLHAAPDHPYGYRIHGDRCEGVYAKTVSSTTLRVVSITAAFADFTPAGKDPLRIAWALPHDQTESAAPEEIHLRAQSVQPRVYFRMDTVRPQGASVYDWPKNMLDALDIGRSGLGLLVWTTRAVGGVQRIVYLPLRAGPSAHKPTDPDTRYRLLVIPGRELEEVYLSVARLDANGQPLTWIVRGNPLRYGYYPAERAIQVPLPFPGAPGSYRLELTATMRGGGTTATELWLYDAWP